MVGAGFVGGGGVVYGADAGLFLAPWVSATSLDLALDPGSFGNPNPDEFGFVRSIVGVWRPCRISAGGRFGNSTRSRILSKGMELVWRNWFCTMKRDRISTKIVSILAE